MERKAHRRTVAGSSGPTRRQKRILAVTLMLTALILAGYVPLGFFVTGFSFGSFALWALLPMLGVYALGLLLFRFSR